MSYLLDTNVCIVLINAKPALSSTQIRSHYALAISKNLGVYTSSIVVHELWYGVNKSKQLMRNTLFLQSFLTNDITTLEYSSADAKAAGEIRAELEKSGKRIGEYDTLIAGQALARNLTLVTANTREFLRIPGLRVEDWTA